MKQGCLMGLNLISINISFIRGKHQIVIGRGEVRFFCAGGTCLPKTPNKKKQKERTQKQVKKEKYKQKVNNVCNNICNICRFKYDT